MDSRHAVTSYTPDCDRLCGLHAQTALIENGFVYVPQSAPWLAECLHEMTVFPKGKHDDQVDPTGQFLEWSLKSRCRTTACSSTTAWSTRNSIHLL
jgi:predicted phage terminase large subunit-like protein